MHAASFPPPPPPPASLTRICARPLLPPLRERARRKPRRRRRRRRRPAPAPRARALPPQAPGADACGSCGGKDDSPAARPRGGTMLIAPGDDLFSSSQPSMWLPSLELTLSLAKTKLTITSTFIPD
ncbi:potassium/sodium hyperpolarization-activated cyclic nucleotide-gated channel 2-like [Balaenoptera musculus]|uniref:Potassium/sodium hyperpolarization-activated cyclic nucleotide-gated channel 2-like n=1 Tax=Balaenoptera musculus TaxID=9771 RepID=A0A8B8VF76_BALMU|nr:potassium/sodium hyperpolarization-activated cyclic nucleotide-gated channel 2-like [Balaenoptera musculus]